MGLPTSDGRETLAEQLFREQASLARMDAALHEEMRRVADLQRRIAEPGEQLAADPSVSPAPILSVRVPNGPSDRDYQLSRCQGFAVEAPTGEVGVVSGVLFGTRLDCPDALEVQVGRLRRRVVVVPVGDVEQIWFDDQRLALARDPRRHPYRERVDRLAVRLRGCS
jgi:hypothetical protein